MTAIEKLKEAKQMLNNGDLCNNKQLYTPDKIRIILDQAIAELESDKNQKAFTYLVKLMNSGLVSLLQFKDAVGISYKEAESFLEELADKDMVSLKKPEVREFTKKMRAHCRVAYRDCSVNEKGIKTVIKNTGLSGIKVRLSDGMIAAKMGLEACDFLDQADAKIESMAGEIKGLKETIKTKNVIISELNRRLDDIGGQC